MMKLQSQFLDNLDQTLKSGIALLSPEFRTLHASYLRSQQTSNGGFCGRSGDTDLYYTEFAVRALTLLDEECDLEPVGRHVNGLRRPPTGVVHAFSVLNLVRMLQKRGVKLRQRKVESLIETADEMLLDSDGSIGNEFLSALCLEMMAFEFYINPLTVISISGRQRRDDGGFKQVKGNHRSQTNATAAAVSYMTMAGEIGKINVENAAKFLSAMQDESGGLKAHTTAPTADLLSTFTGLVGLALLGALDRVNLAGIAKFAKDVASPEGGFRGWPGDTQCDTEYTYYGVATIALLRLHASNRTEGKA